MTLLENEREDLTNVQNRLYALRQEVHKYLPPPESDREFNRLSKALMHISAAIDTLTGKAETYEIPVKMELLTTIRMESGFIREKCFFQCPVCKTIKVYDMYNYKLEIPKPNICKECSKGLSKIGNIEQPEI